jgi:excisionase family DNA binding protein
MSAKRFATRRSDGVGTSHFAPDSPWLTTSEAAAYARLSPKTLLRAIAAGRLRHARVGGRRSIRLRREWIDAWLLATAHPLDVPVGATR